MSKKYFTSSSSVRSYADTYNTFSGCDMTVIMNIPIIFKGREHTLKYVVGELQTLTYSTSMNRQPVRSISNVNAKDYVMGQRTIAGTMVFSVFDRHFSERILDNLHKLYGTGANILVDELPPMNINIVMANEYGSNSNFVIYGVRFINEGQVMSINDIYMENTYQYVATGLKYADNKRHINKAVNSKKITRKKHIAKAYPFKNVAGVGDNVIIGTPWKDVIGKDVEDIVTDPDIDIDDIPIFDNIIDPTKPPKDIDDLPSDIEDNNSYEFVSLIVQEKNWINNKREVVLDVAPKRNTGLIQVEGIDNDIGFFRDYYGKSLIIALPKGQYMCQYVDKKASSNIEYLDITKEERELIDTKPDKDKSDNDYIKDDKEQDIPIIEDTTDKEIIIIEDELDKDDFDSDKDSDKDKGKDNTYVKNDKGVVFYPDKNGVISNLEPNTEYILISNRLKNRIIVKTDKSILDLYDKLKENLSNYFLEDEEEFENILFNLKSEIEKGLNIAEASYEVLRAYSYNDNPFVNDFLSNLMFHSTNLLQKKKIYKNGNNTNMPLVYNYSTNRIKLNKESEKLIVHKFPINENPPLVIHEEDFFIRNGQKFYEIKDYRKNLYKVYSIDKYGNKSPSIMVYSGIDNKEMSFSMIKNVNYMKIKEDFKSLEDIKVDKKIFLVPRIQEQKKDNFNIIIKDIPINKGYKIVLCNIDNLNDPRCYINKTIDKAKISYDVYDLGLSNESIFIYWIIDKYERIVTSPYPLILDSQKRNDYNKYYKDKFYYRIMNTDNFRSLSPISRSIVSKTIEDNNISEYDIKINFLKDMVKNKIKNTSFNEDLIFFDNLFFEYKTGVKKVDFKEVAYTDKNIISLEKGYKALITIVCPLTSEVKIIELKELIDLSKFNNKFIIINIFNNTLDIWARPKFIPIFNNKEVNYE